MSGDHLNGHIHFFGKQAPPYERADPVWMPLLATLTESDMHAIRQIAERAVDLAKAHGVNALHPFTLALDISVTHLNHWPLNFTRLLMCSDDDLSHDVFGIGRFLDRHRGKLVEGFKPRHAQPGGPINEGQAS